jgi:putative endonuclease
MSNRDYFVYIMASLSHSLYVGVTSDLRNRVWEHKEGIFAGHTSKYKITRLAYYEQFSDVTNAIAREKQIKGWLRRKKLDLIEAHNPQWLDLSADWKA